MRDVAYHLLMAGAALVAAISRPAPRRVRGPLIGLAAVAAHVADRVYGPPETIAEVLASVSRSSLEEVSARGL